MRGHPILDNVRGADLGWRVDGSAVQLSMGKLVLEISNADTQVGVDLKGKLSGKGDLLAQELLVFLLDRS